MDSLPVHIFSQLLGLFLGEWKNTGNKTRSLLATGLVLLIVSAVIAGYAGSPASLMAKMGD
jgi:hypothetical protein